MQLCNCTATTASIWQGAGDCGRTKSSSAVVPKVAFLGDSFMFADMSIRSGARAASLLNSASKACTNGLRETGRSPALPGVRSPGDAPVGEPALLRKGLLDERLRDKLGDRRSIKVRKGCYQRTVVFVTTQEMRETSDKGALPGIDCSAIMMAPLAAILAMAPNQKLAGREWIRLQNTGRGELQSKNDAWIRTSQILFASGCCDSAQCVVGRKGGRANKTAAMMLLSGPWFARSRADRKRCARRRNG